MLVLESHTLASHRETSVVMISRACSPNTRIAEGRSSVTARCSFASWMHSYNLDLNYAEDHSPTCSKISQRDQRKSGLLAMSMQPNILKPDKKLSRYEYSSSIVEHRVDKPD